MELGEGDDAARSCGACPPGPTSVRLDREGKALSSEDLAELIAERRMSRADLAFVVGGPFGLDAAVLERADQQAVLRAR